MSLDQALFTLALRLKRAVWRDRAHAAELAREVVGPRRLLRRMFGVPVNFFAYPSGAFDAAVVAAVRRAGYQGATTTEYGLALPGEPYTLDRIAILRSDGVTGLAKKLRTAVRAA